MLRDQILPWLPLKEREKVVRQLSGQVLIKFPATFASKLPKSPMWMNLTPGGPFIIKSGPFNIVSKSMKILDKYNAEYQIEYLEKGK